MGHRWLQEKVMQNKILVVCLNPTLQRTLYFEDFKAGEVNRSKRSLLSVGGKGADCARILTQLGAEAVLLSHQGGEEAELHANLCHEAGFTLCSVDAQVPVRCCTTVLHDGMATELVEEGTAVPSGTEEGLRKLFGQRIAESDALIITGSRCAGYSDFLYRDFCREARDLGKTVVLDVRGEDLRRCLEVEGLVVKPNLSEFVSTFLPDCTVTEGHEGGRTVELAEQKMVEVGRMAKARILLTHGRWPALCFDGEQPYTLQVPPVDRVVNTIGCGDGVCSGLCLALLGGVSFPDACASALSVGSKVAQTFAPGSII